MKPKVQIEICGGIGVGKSTLAHVLAQQFPGSVVALEDFQSNSLWHRYYEEPHKYVLEKNISFLAQHFAELKYYSAPVLVADFSPLQDLAYAAIVGDQEHYDVMSKIYTHLRKRSPIANLVVVHLVTTLPRQSSQIEQRGRKEEKYLTQPQLLRLNTALSEILKSEATQLTVIEVDTSITDLRNNVQTALALASRIRDESNHLFT